MRHKKTLIFVALITPLAPWVNAANLVKPLAIYGAEAGADYFSTRYAMEHGAWEANAATRGRLATVKLAEVAGLTVVDYALQKGGHRGAARWMRIGAAVVSGGVAVWNLRNGSIGRHNVQ